MEEQEAALQYTKGKSSEDVTAYSSNYKAHKKGISKEEMVNAYTEWSKNGKYDEDLNPTRYRGPVIATQALAEYFEKSERSSIRILDVAAGSGLLGQELAKFGFTNIDALDPSEGMLDEAVKRNVYTKFICQYFDNNSDIPCDSYDVLIISGGMGEGHIPGNSIEKMQEIVKEGGLVVIVMRKEYLTYVEDYKDLIPRMKQMEEDNKWKILSCKTVEGYSFNKQGLVFILKVLQSKC